MTTAYAYPLILRQLPHAPLANTPDQEIVHADIARYRYRELPARLDRLAGTLAGLGVGPGSVVAVMDWHSHRYFECFFAAPMMGATLHTVDVRLSAEQVLYTINHAEDDLMLVHEDFVPPLAQIADRIERPLRMVLLRDRPGPLPHGLDFAGEFDSLLDAVTTDYPFTGFDESTRATLVLHHRHHRRAQGCQLHAPATGAAHACGGGHARAGAHPRRAAPR